MASIMDKLKNNSKLKATEILSESKFFNEKDMIKTDVPMINVALSGDIDGGGVGCWRRPGVGSADQVQERRCTACELRTCGRCLCATRKALVGVVHVRA